MWSGVESQVKNEGCEQARQKLDEQGAYRWHRKQALRGEIPVRRQTLVAKQIKRESVWLEVDLSAGWKIRGHEGSLLSGRSCWVYVWWCTSEARQIDLIRLPWNQKRVDEPGQF